jgi:hypothetical protein
MDEEDEGDAADESKEEELAPALAEIEEGAGESKEPF